MTRVTVHDFVRKVALYVPAEQETGHVITWLQSRMKGRFWAWRKKKSDMSNRKCKERKLTCVKNLVS